MGEKLRLSSCPGSDIGEYDSACLYVLGIGIQGHELNDLSKSLGTRVSLLPCGLPHPYQNHGSGRYVSTVPQKQASEFYCVLFSSLQRLQGWE